MEGRELVFPGDKMATEEELIPGKDVFVENGNIYARAVGRSASGDGKADIGNTYKEIRKVARGMAVVGTVVGVLPAVVFLNLDTVRIGRTVLAPIKDGKIVMKSERPDRGRGGGFRGGRDDGPREPEFRVCGMGDVVLAHVFRDDEDNYELSVRNPEEGVVFAKCERCGMALKFIEADNMLACTKCKTRETKKISPLYGNPEGIKSYIEKLHSV
jgi:exosome complex component CSL4